jgi:Zn-dependent metalloprotease
MKQLYVRKKFSILLLLASVLIACKDSFGQGPPEILPKDRDNAIGVLKNTIEKVSQEKPKVFTTSDKYVRFIMAPPGTSFTVESAYRNSPQHAANWFLNNWSGLFANYSPGNSFRIIRNIADKSNNHYVRYQQYYNGIEVHGAQLNCMVNSSGGVVAILSDIMRDTSDLDTGRISSTPILSSSLAQNIAIKFISNKHPKLSFKATVYNLVIFDPTVAGLKGKICLAWKVKVNNTNELMISENLFVDASTGEIVHRVSLIYQALTREIWDYDGGTSNPTLEREEGDPDTYIPDVDDVYYYLKNTYDFYYYQHGWENYDGSSNTYSKAYVQLGGDHNGWWYTSYMVLTENSAFDDLVGHEFTHGVIENTAQLEAGYYTESSAINESLCDMWGEWIDQTNGVSKTGYDQSYDKWLFGEDDSIKPWRDMKEPHNPNTYAGPSPSYLYEPGYWDNNQECHQNAGVGNKLCYLLTEGDVFNGFRISGFGISKASELFFECMRYWLLPTSDYYDLGYCLQQSAITLNWDSIDRSKVESACRAVEILPDMAFEFRNSSGETVAFFTNEGNLHLKGTLTVTNTYRPSPDDYKDEFIVDTPYGISAVLDLETGNLAVKYLDDNFYYMNYYANGFIIKNSDGDVVAYIDSGGLVLKGIVLEHQQ